MEMVSINKLYPHPQNPRRDVGDIAELADGGHFTGMEGRR